MGSDSIEAQVKELIVELLFLRDVTPDDISDDDVMEETLGVDSVQLFQIVAGLQGTFDIRFADEIAVIAGSVHIVRAIDRNGR